MESFIIFIILFLAATLFGVLEYTRHQRRIHFMPIRIHINGTRGKSSVTRLIGAGLRAGGIRTITKVTGTFPRLILEDGAEVHIFRKGQANIIEQLSVTRLAHRRRAEALVIECMALEPQYQKITERKMIHATIGVITNARLDHTDVMGKTLPEIAAVLGETIPAGQHLFTAEQVVPGIFEKIARRRNTAFHHVDAGTVSAKEMDGFSYLEHRENVALALAVCAHLGIDRRIALAGMHASEPDPGALKIFTVHTFDKTISFFNAFAANDPDSTYMIWEKLSSENRLQGSMILLLNTRLDRLDRARQLAEMAGRRLAHATDYLVLIGQSTDVVERIAAGNGIPQQKIINLGWTTPEAVFEKIMGCTKDTASVLAIGNMGGMGAGVAEFFENRSLVNA